MAKRFTDSDKWKNPWFRTLPSAYRWLWVYMLDNCDAAGVWMTDFQTAGYFIGEDITADMAREIFGDKIVEIDSDKWFIPSFITFQYGQLKSDSRPHQSVIKILEKYGIDPISLTVSKGYPKGIQTLKDKDKEQVKEKDKDKERVIEEIYANLYPLKKGKSAGIKKLAKDIKTDEDLGNFEAAVRRYAEDCVKASRDAKYIQHFSTFASNWKDWLDPSAGSTSVKNSVDAMLEEMGRLIEEGA